MARNKFFAKKAISLLLCFLMLFSLIPQLTVEVNAATMVDDFSTYTTDPFITGTEAATIQKPYKMLVTSNPWIYDGVNDVMKGPAATTQGTAVSGVLGNEYWGDFSGEITVSADVAFTNDTKSNQIGLVAGYSTVSNGTSSKVCYYKIYLKRTNVLSPSSTKSDATLYIEKRAGSSGESFAASEVTSKASIPVTTGVYQNLKVNIKKVNTDDAQIDVYIDDTLKLSVKDTLAASTDYPALLSGKVGLYFYNYDAASSCQFDNFTVVNSAASILPPDGLTATLNGNQASITWNAVTGASSYNVYRKAGSGSYTQIATNLTTTAYTDTGLLDGVTYTYAVRAIDSSAQETADSNVASVTLAPSVPTGVTAAPGDNNVNLSWGAVTGAAGYNIYRSELPGVVTGAAPFATAAVSNYTDSTALNGNTYYYKVTAVNSAGESPSSNEVSATPVAPATPPSAPVNLSASVSEDKTTITWDAVNNASSYTIKRSTTSGGSYTTIQSAINDTSYLDQGLTLGTYYYVVSASNSAGEGLNSAEISTAIVLPSAPTGLAATTPSSGKVSLTWSYTGAANGYNAYISSDGGSTYTKVNTSLVTSKFYDVTNLTNDTTYYFKVTIVNNLCESLMSVPVSAIPVYNPPVTINVNPSTFSSALATAIDGSTLVLSDGTYSSFTIKNKSNITIKAAEDGNNTKPVFSSSSGIYITACPNMVIDGVDFSMTIGGGAYWLKIMDSQNVQIKNCHFYSPATAGTGSTWIFIGGNGSRDNYIGYNLLENKNDTGKFIIIDGGGTPRLPSQNDVIEHNTFRNTLGRQPNESEPVRLGVSDLVTFYSYTVVQYNTFERCDSDPEIISVKSSGNIIRYNTFKESLGTVCIRQAFDTEVYGNYFLGNGRSDNTGHGTGGVRIYSNGHKVYNNYFEGLTGTQWDAAITMTDGDAVNPESAGTSLTAHYPAKNVIVANNTFVNNEHNFEIGFKNATGDNQLSKPITNVTIANNLVVGSKNELIRLMDQPDNLTLSGNIMFPIGDAKLVTNPSAYDSYWNILTSAQIKVVNPILIKSGEYYKLSKNSPAVDAALGNYSPTGNLGFITKDIDGDVRLPVAVDVGADEFIDSGISDTTQPEWGNTSPLSLSAGTTTTSITISWSPASDNVAISHYEIYKNGALYSVATNSTTFTAVNLQSNTKYDFTVKAVDTKGNKSIDSNVVSETTLDKVITSISIDNLSDMLVGGLPLQIIINATYNDNTIKDITGAATITSSRPDIAEISSTGQVTPVSGGTTVITAKFGDLTATYVLTVKGAVKTTLTAVIDSYVRQNNSGTDKAYADTNYGTAEVMQVKNNSNTEYRDGFVQFDISGISGNVAHSTLKLGISSLDSNTSSCEFYVYGMNDDNWSELALTYNNQPAEVGTLLGTATANSSTVGNYIEVDVTDYIKTQTDGKATFRIRGKTSGSGFKLVTKESSTNSPKIPLLVALSTQGEPASHVTDINLDKTSADMKAGEKLQLTATLIPSGANGTVAWVSSVPNVVTVNQYGLVSALAAGTAKVRASVTDSVYGTVYADCSINVSGVIIPGDPVITSITIGGPDVMQVNDPPLPTVVIATYSDNSTKIVTYGITYISSAPSVAAISSTGLVTPISVGETVITAVYNTISAAKLVVIQGSYVTTLRAANDAYVRQNNSGTDKAYADTNYGTSEVMQVKNNSNTEYRDGFVQFDISGISGNIAESILKLGIASLDSNTTSCEFAVYGMNADNWNEATITYNNQPAEVETLLGGATADTSTVGKYIEFDVTNFVKSQTDGKVTFRIRGNTSGKGFKLVTKESTTSTNAPLLAVSTAQKIPVTGIKLNMNSAEIKVGGTLQLVGSILPDGATGSLTWNSSDTNIVQVDQNGFVTAKAAGTAKVRATVAKSASESVFDECTINVVNPSPVVDDGQTGGGDDETQNDNNKPNDDTKTATTPADNSKREVSADELKKELEKASSDTNGVKTAQIEVAKVDSAKVYEVTLPATAITEKNLVHEIEVKTPVATAVLPSNMLETSQINGAAKVTLSVEVIDKNDIKNKDVLEKVGDRLVLDISLKLGDKVMEYNNPNAPLTISIPYTPTKEELKNPEQIIVHYIDIAGNAVKVPNGRYVAKTGMVTFKTTHLSKYAISFDNKTFADLDSFSWAKKEIEVLAAKGIINGTTNTTFSPSENITRADFMVMLVRTLGLTAEFNDNFSDVNKSDYYYNVLGIAKKLGICKGSGDNQFNPNENISRQDMMVLAARALSLMKIIDTKASSSDIAKFSDKSSVADYAALDVAAMVKAGIVTGDGDTLNPLGNATRAETAIIMYRIYNKQ